MHGISAADFTGYNILLLKVIDDTRSLAALLDGQKEIKL